MGFRIDGSDYEIPELGSFLMGEAMILYDNTGLMLSDFALDEDDPTQAEKLTRNILHPGTVKTRMVVAYMRGNRNASREAAEAIIDQSNWLEAYLGYTAAFRSEDAAPLANQNAEGTENEASSNGPSGGTSIEHLAAQEDPRTSTGTSE